MQLRYKSIMLVLTVPVIEQKLLLMMKICINSKLFLTTNSKSVLYGRLLKMEDESG